MTVEPADADDASAVAAAVKYTTSDEAIAKVAADGTMTAVAAGTATITATSGKLTASCKATISAATPAPKPATGLKLSQATWSGKVGDTKKLTVTAEPADADDADAVVKAVAYTSSDETIATVAVDGTVTAIKAGSATITATSGKLTATCKATISAAAN